MALFSQRKGIKPLQKELQIESIDLDLKNKLWTVLCRYYWNNHEIYVQEFNDLKYALWVQYFKKAIDKMPKFLSEFRSGDDCYNFFRNYFFACKWNEEFDFIEFIVKNSDFAEMFPVVSAFNSALEEESSAYRFVDKEIVQITDRHEIETIEEAINESPEGVRTHFQSALSMLADRNKPDYRNSIKESISAVEGLCKRIANNPKATLSDALKRIKDNINIHPALENGFNNIYGYTSSKETGIRHAMMEQSTVKFTDAKFMLSACSAFVNYLLGKCAENDIKL